MAPRNRKARARTPLVWDVTEYLDRTHSPEDLGAALAGIAESRDAVLPQCADAAAAEMIGLEAHLRSMVTAFSMAVELTPKQTGDAILTALPSKTAAINTTAPAIVRGPRLPSSETSASPATSKPTKSAM